MAGASAGHTAKKSGARLRTIGKTANGRYAKKSEVAAHRAANTRMAASFKRSLAQTKRS